MSLFGTLVSQPNFDRREEHTNASLPSSLAESFAALYESILQTMGDVIATLRLQTGILHFQYFALAIAKMFLLALTVGNIFTPDIFYSHQCAYDSRNQSVRCAGERKVISGR